MGLFLNLKDDIKKLEKKVILINDNQDKLSESYDLYNKAIDMINNNCFESSKKLLESAKLINDNDVEIINAIGLVNLLYCNFDEACKFLYKSDKMVSNNLSQKYINILTSKEFRQFLEYYNLAISKANELNYIEAIEIFLDIINEENNLIEPYIMIYLLYKQIGNNEKEEEYLNLIKIKDKDNNILNDIYRKEFINESVNQKNKLNNKNNIRKISKIMLLFFIMLIFSYKYINPNLNETIEKDIDDSKKIKTYNEKNKNNKKDLENEEEFENSNLMDIPDEAIIKRANNFKKNKEYKEAIDMYKNIVKLDRNTYIVSEAIYQIAVLNESIKNYNEAIKYYDKYIKNYSTSYSYYDESYYNIAMIYYNNNDVEKSKQYLSELIVKDPDSIYNNSKVKEILEK